jgi:alpha 1,3-glucosidase
MFVEFPEEVSAFDNQVQYMVGPALLIRPVTTPNAKSVSVFLPSGQPWYDYFSHVKYPAGTIETETPLDRIPLYIRGGHIVPIRARVRSSSTLMKHDPFTLVIALDDKHTAVGELYVDDGETFDFLDGLYLHRRFIFENETLSCQHADGYETLSFLEDPSLNQVYADSKATKTLRVERIIILGAPSTVNWKHAIITSSGQTESRKVEVTCRTIPASLGDHGAVSSTRCVVRDPATLVGDNWKLKLSA